MANIKIIDLPTGSPESTSFVEATQVDELAESGRATVKLALNALGNFVAGQGASPLEYGDLETESTTLIGGINELHDSIGANAYDDTATYAEGELCIYNNTLYVCTVSGGITTPEAWTAAHWTDTTIETLLNTKQNSTDNSLSTDDKTIVGAINELKSVIATSNFWKTEKLTIANAVSVAAGVETQPVTVSIPQYAGYTVLTFTEIRATGYHGAKVTIQAELLSTTELVYALYNPSNVNATATVTVRVIYVKTIT